MVGARNAVGGLRFDDGQRGLTFLLLVTVVAENAVGAPRDRAPDTGAPSRSRETSTDSGDVARAFDSYGCGRCPPPSPPRAPRARSSVHASSAAVRIRGRACGGAQAARERPRRVPNFVRTFLAGRCDPTVAQLRIPMCCSVDAMLSRNDVVAQRAELCQDTPPPNGVRWKLANAGAQ